MLISHNSVNILKRLLPLSFHMILFFFLHSEPLNFLFVVYSLDKRVVLCSLHQYTNVDFETHTCTELLGLLPSVPPCSNKIQT